MDMDLHGDPTNDETRIRAAYATWLAAMESGNMADGLSVVTPDVFHRGPSGEERVGREALAQALRAFMPPTLSGSGGNSSACRY